jgi:hypothetical protein
MAAHMSDSIFQLVTIILLVLNEQNIFLYYNLIVEGRYTDCTTQSFVISEKLNCFLSVSIPYRHEDVE